jgi:hypothetical protein
MPPRSSREDVPLPSEHYHDDDNSVDESPRASEENADNQEDALSFMRIDEQEFPASDDHAADVPWQIKHSVRTYSAKAQRWWRATVKWTKGPQPPRPWKITPVFAEYQALPITIRDYYFPKRSHKIWLLIAFYGCWLLTFSLVLRKSAFASSIEGYGAPHMINCAARFWYVVSTSKIDMCIH